MNTWDKAQELICEINNRCGCNAFIVGGAVRDKLMNIISNDIDIVVECPIEEIDSKFPSHDIGRNKAFGLTVVRYKGEGFEVAEAKNGNIIDDLNSRDFTINSIADNTDCYIDPHHGIRDIDDEIIRCVGNPFERFTEDPLRILRMARFAAKFDFIIHIDTLFAANRCSSGISTVSPERIRDELVKMAKLDGIQFAECLKIMEIVGVIDIILPELANTKNFKETEEHHPEAFHNGNGSVFDHIISAIDNNITVDNYLINLSLLFHDIGKPNTFVKVGDKCTFHGHDKEAEEIINNICDRLRFSNDDRECFIFVATKHMKMSEGDKMKPSKIFRLVSDKNWSILKQVSYCDDVCRIGKFNLDRFNNIISAMEESASKWASKSKDKKNFKVVDGKRVMELTGLPPSKKVGDIIKKVSYLIIDDGADINNMDNLIMNIYKGER